MAKSKNSDKPIEYSALKKSHNRRLEQKQEKMAEQARLDRWDPRFDDTCGKLDRTQFRQAYSFMDDMRRKEKSRIGEELDAIREEVESGGEEDANGPFDYKSKLHERRKALKKEIRGLSVKRGKRKRKFGVKRAKQSPASAC